MSDGRQRGEGARQGGPTPRCLLCGGGEARPLFEVAGATVWQCRLCDMVFAPTPEVVHYDGAYMHGAKPSPAVDYLAEDPFLFDDARRRLRRVDRLAVGRGRLLDVGCAGGHFLAEAQRRGWHALGLDVSAEAVAFARERLGVAARVGALPRPDWPDGSFDCITAWHVLEHLSDPAAFLREVRRLLRPKGWLFLETPVVDGWGARHLGPRWPQWKPGEHLVYFSTRTLARTLWMEGFDVRRRWRGGGTGLAHAAAEGAPGSGPRRWLLRHPRALSLLRSAVRWVQFHLRGRYDFLCLAAQRRPEPRPPLHRPRRIAVMKLGGIGDVVTATPVLRALRRAYPEAHIALLAEQPGLQVVEGSPYVDEYLEFTRLYRTQRPLRFLRRSVLGELGALAWSLLSRRWDLYVELHCLLFRTSVCKPLVGALLTRAPVRAGLDSEGRGFFLSVRVPDFRLRPVHHVERMRELIRGLGLPDPGPRTEVWLEAEHREEAEALLRQTGVDGKTPLVGVHVGANPDFPVVRSWPAERFARVCNHLAERYGATVLLTGTASERQMVAEVVGLAQCPEALVDLSGRTSVKVLAALMEHLSLYISNDTGSMHVAVAMGVATIGIFGPGDWQSYGTYPPESGFRMVRTPVNCWPCTDRACVSRACMLGVTVEQVIGEVDAVLGVAEEERRRHREEVSRWGLAEPGLSKGRRDTR